jgi:hypothetical protein
MTASWVWVSERDALAAAVPRYMELLRTTSFMPNLDQPAAGLNRIGDDPVKVHMSRESISVRADTRLRRSAAVSLRSSGTASLGCPLTSTETAIQRN